MIAIGSQNGSIYLFRVSRDGFSYKKINKIRGSQPLTHMDWSMDGSYLQTVTVDYDLLFWDVKSLSPEKSPIAMKDVKWFSHNCVVGFLVAGIWNNRYYSAPSTITTCHRGPGSDALVTGDAEGYLRMFRYPVITPRAEYNASYLLQRSFGVLKGNNKIFILSGSQSIFRCCCVRPIPGCR